MNIKYKNGSEINVHNVDSKNVKRGKRSEYIEFDFGKCRCGNMLLTFSEYSYGLCVACHIKNTGLRKDKTVVEY